MAIEAKHKKHIERIMGTMTCPKDFECSKSDFTEYCKASYVSERDFVKCFEPDPEKCWFSGLTENGYICNCPIRVYIAVHTQ